MTEYNDKSKKEAIEEIGDFEANYGGTNIFGPTKSAFEENIPKDA